MYTSNNGKEWSLKESTKSYCPKKKKKTLGKVASHGMYDVNNNKGFVIGGMSSVTVVFAVNSIISWH